MPPHTPKLLSYQPLGYNGKFIPAQDMSSKSSPVLVLSLSDIRRDPRVFRQIDVLKGQRAVLAAGTGIMAIDGVTSYTIPIQRRTPVGRAHALFCLKTGRFEQFYWSQGHVIRALADLGHARYPFVIANDIQTLPLALHLARGAPVLVDLHEYSPRELEDRWLWRFLFQKYSDYLCRQYLPKATMVTTVCAGIAEEYTRQYGARPTVITNAPRFHSLPVHKTDPSRIRVIHHGVAARSRRIESMIELANLLDARFTVDFILIPGDAKYIVQLMRQAAGSRNIQFLPRVEMNQIVPFSAQYDVGLFLLEPTNFNYLHALPNKFFEFLQARLAVAIGPSPEMARIISQFGCGLVSQSFEPQALAKELNRLDAGTLDKMKAQSSQAAAVHCAERNADLLKTAFACLLSGPT
ncbi:MAG: hypothetical protein V5B35_14170 [Candidatus Accumulibacter necessarius]|uniref:hypothetical protein n=1 Tax=Candidatus Accumulibacter necessarius TaxID=2954386 RepID=UPI002FC355F0